MKNVVNINIFFKLKVPGAKPAKAMPMAGIIQTGY